MSKGLAIGLFLALLAVGVMFGLARDFYSRQRAVVTATVIEADAGGPANKSLPMRPPSLKAQLASGEIVDVAVTQVSGITAGQTVTVAEMVMPWGQTWYRLKAE